MRRWKLFITNYFTNKTKDPDDRKELLTVILPTFLIHFFAGILTFLTILVLTRKLGARQYGIFTYSFGIITLIANVAMSGINILSMREPPALLSKGKKELWRGFYLWSSKFVFTVPTLIALLVAVFILCDRHFHIFEYSPYAIPVLFALIAIPFYSFMNYYSALLIGQHKTVLSFLPDNIIKPIFFLIFLFCFIHFNIWNAIWARNLSLAVGFLFAMVMFFRNVDMEKISPQYNTAAWKSSLKSFFLLVALGSLNGKLDILLLGYYKNASQVGIYNVADMLAAKIAIFQTIINPIYIARISKLHTLNEKEKLQNLITRITRWVTVLSIPVFLIAIFCSKWILSYFGPAFIKGQTTLIIICIGQFICLLFGPVGSLSITTKNEKTNIVFLIIKMAVIVGINIILTPLIGMVGTAIATALSMIFWNAGMCITTKRRTGINTWIFG